MKKFKPVFFIVTIMLVVSNMILDAFSNMFDIWKLSTLCWIISCWLSEIMYDNQQKYYEQISRKNSTTNYE